MIYRVGDRVRNLKTGKQGVVADIHGGTAFCLDDNGNQIGTDTEFQVLEVRVDADLDATYIGGAWGGIETWNDFEVSLVLRQEAA